MKYVVVLIDGMADEPIEALGGITPLAYANIPMIDELSKFSELGMVHTIPEGMPAGSDVANLSLMGYDPKQYHTGRSPLEASNIGIPMADDDIIYRCNFVTVSNDPLFEEKVMIDHSASDITNEEAQALLLHLKNTLENDRVTFHAGTSYRNILLEKEGSLKVTLVPPHDFLNQKISNYMPKGPEWIDTFTRKSYELLNNHPINQKRIEKGLNPANCVWIWGEGKKPSLDLFEEKYALKAATISAVDLIKGIGKCAGMDAIEVAGATGTIDTNFTGKADACIKALKGDKDFVYLHLEATDECSHQGQLTEKIRAVEIIDQKVVAYLRGLFEENKMAYRMLILPDHPTPVRTRTHTSNPVPYLMYDSEKMLGSNHEGYNELSCESTKRVFGSGPELMQHFLSNVK